MDRPKRTRPLVSSKSEDWELAAWVCSTNEQTCVVNPITQPKSQAMEDWAAPTPSSVMKCLCKNARECAALHQWEKDTRLSVLH